MKFALLILAVIVLAGCANSTSGNSDEVLTSTSESAEKPEPKTNSEEQELATAFAKLQTSIRNKSAPEFQQLLSTDFGLYIIETPGAVPQIRRVYSIADFAEQNTKQGFFDLAKTDSACILTFRDFPDFSCETYLPGQNSGFTEDGCFAGENQKLTSENLFNYVEIKPADAKKMLAAAQKIRYAILETNMHRKYYFGNVNGSWKLLFVNISKPCSA